MRNGLFVITALLMAWFTVGCGGGTQATASQMTSSVPASATTSASTPQAAVASLAATGSPAQAATQAESVVVDPQPSSGAQPPPQATAAGFANLAFDDEMTTPVAADVSNGTAGTANWYMPAQWWGGPTSSSCLSQSGSVLTISGCGGVTGFASAPGDGSTTSHNNYAFKYGYWEASFTRPDCYTNSGEWAAWWLLPSPANNSQNSGYSGELDIFEGNVVAGGTGNNGSGTYHVWSNGNTDAESNNSADSYPMPSGTNCTQQTIYGLLWTPGNLQWYINNHLVNSVSYSSSQAKTAFDGSLAYYMILDRQDGAGSMGIDWVRVWQP